MRERQTERDNEIFRRKKRWKQIEEQRDTERERE